MQSGPEHAGFAVTSSWRGVILLGNPQAEDELCAIIQTFVPQCVDVGRRLCWASAGIAWNRSE